MSYGKRRYGKVNKQVEQPVDNSLPTYQCGKCKDLKTSNIPFAELSLIENKQSIYYTKLCGSCAILLTTWLKQ